MNVTPPLPTDNLYKFLALAGLVICAASVAGLEHQLDLVDARLEQYELATADYASEAQVYSNHVARLKGISRPSRVDLAALDSLNDRLGRINQLSEVRRRLVGQAMDSEKRDHIFLYIGSAFGLGLSLAGFSLWYGRLQRYQDTAVRLQAEETQAAQLKS